MSVAITDESSFVRFVLNDETYDFQKGNLQAYAVEGSTDGVVISDYEKVIFTFYNVSEFVTEPENTGQEDLIEKLDFLFASSGGGGGGGFDPSEDYEFTGNNSFTQPLEIAEGTEDNHAATVGQLDAAIEEVEIDESNLVHKNSPETITGVKTFSASPIVPNATNDGEAVNNLQMETAIAAAQDNLQAQISNNSNDIATLNQTAAMRRGRFANKSIVAFGSRSPNYAMYSNGTDTTETSRFAAKAIGNVSEVQIVYLYSDYINTAIVTTYDDITIEASLEYPAGTFNRITFDGGSNNKLIKKGMTIVSDTVRAYLPPNTPFWIRTNILVNPGQVWLKSRATTQNLLSGTVGEGVVVGANQVMSGTIANSNSYTFGPTAIIGVSDTARGSIFCFGDSIFTGGSTDSTQPQLGFGEQGGYMGRVFGDTWPILRCNISGQRVLHWQKSSGPVANNYDDLLSLGQYAVSNLGINDVRLGSALATIQSHVLNIWYSQKSRGIKMYHCTLTPNTTSTDGWTTTTNQTVTIYEANRVGFNDWLRDGAPINITTRVAAPVGTPSSATIVRFGDVKHPASGYFETADEAESARNSGLWKATYTSDGLHPNTTSYPIISTAIDTTKFLV